MIAPGNDEQFNPYSLHMTARIPVALFGYLGLSPGAKLLYARLALFRGRKQGGFCAPNLETLSQAMAVSRDTIERWLDELVTEGFIVRKRRRRAAAECVFLPHPCSLSPQKRRIKRFAKTPQKRAIKGQLLIPQLRG